MMSVKGGVQTWSKPTGAEFNKSEGTENVSASDRDKALGGNDNIGDLLNQVADPNYVADSKKMRTTGNPVLGKDSFMTLLLTQMKNQDPTNPLKSHEMAAQLAQFTSLEKMTNINESIAGLRKDLAPDHNFQALSFIGKTIATDNSKVTHADANERHDVRFALPSDAPKVSMTIRNAEGQTVRTLEFRNLKSGKNELAWNGMTDDGKPAPVGDYSAVIEAEASNGHKLQADMKMEGTISGVNFTARGPQLMVGNKVIAMSDVKSIGDANLAKAAAPAAPAPEAHAMPIPGANAPAAAAPAKSPKKVGMKPETKANAEIAAKLGRGTLNDAGMAQGLINQLNKVGAKAGMEM